MAENDVLYISDLCRYFNDHQIPCSLNQLCILLSPFASKSATLTFDEFSQFIDSLTKEVQMNECLVEAFPATFGVTTHIDLSAHQDVRVAEGLHRTRSVAQNMNSLPLNDDGRGFARSRRRVIAGSFSCVQLGFFAFGTSDASCLYAVSLLNKHPT